MSDVRAGVSPPGFRLPDEARPGRVALRVADLDRSLSFYQELIGFVLHERSASGARWARLGAGSDTLLELRESRGARRVPPRGLLGLYHFALLLPDRQALGSFLRQVSQAGLRVGAADHLVSEALYLTDPDGITMEVYRDRPREEWGVRDGELLMSSDPLDLTELAAAGPSPWVQVPAGSRIGHMHFYVGNLQEAERFYHLGLGFDKVVWSYPGALFLSAGGYHHHVGTNTWAAGAATATEGDAGLVGWELRLPDQESVSAASRSLAAAGALVETRNGAPRATDGWSNVVELIVG
jgi:catechol 2,3-dioxygenase